jgi:hypothetical protein
VLSLAGEWRVRLDPTSVGTDEHWERADYSEAVHLPGSLDQNGKGTPNNEAHRSRLSRLHEYVGPAWYQREIDIPEAWAGRALELFLERCHWETRLWIDDQPMGMRDSLCAPHVYAIAPLSPGRHRLTLRIDNTIKYDVGMRAHSITEHTQTNWNGVIGRMELRALAPITLDSVQIYPNAAQRTATIRIVAKNKLNETVTARLLVSALASVATRDIEFAPASEAQTELVLNLGPDAPLWDEFDPRLIDTEVRLESKVATDVRNIRFGLRDFARNGTQFTLNGRPYYVRGTLECCIFPLTAFPPTDTAAWRRIMDTIRQYGLNHMRFHSWCPPDAAFTAADETGITLEVETPVWGDLGKIPEVDQFIRDESARILEAYGNHPSFTMLAVGNEPSGPNKNSFLTAIVEDWRRSDNRRLYTTCAGWPELPVSDFHIVHERLIGEKDLQPYRLHGGRLGPATDFDYRDVLEGCERPAIAHELGQWCVYPDYREIANYTGVLRARNLEGFRDSLRENGMLDQACDFAWASGQLQRLLYKDDIEALLRTPGSGGFQLLALHDFPGQGSALEGFLDAFWNSKGAITSDEFRRFCSETVPLLRIGKRVWTTPETLVAHAELTHFGAAPLKNAQPCWTASADDGTVLAEGQWPTLDIPLGNAIPLGDIELPLAQVTAPSKITLSVFLEGTTARNSWDVWVYPLPEPASAPDCILVAAGWADNIEALLHGGAKVLLLPKHIAPMHRLKSAFEPIFWNTQWFPGQDRQLGILCDARHPAFAAFPNDGHSDWQWWELLHPSNVLRLDIPDPKFRPLVQVIDDWNKNRMLGAIFEARVGQGRVLVCTLDIESDLEHRPAAAALRKSLIDYMNSDRFAPACKIDPAWFKTVFRQGENAVAQVEASSAARQHAPENAVDGNPDTFWRPRANTTSPHELRLYLAQETELKGLRCTPAPGAPQTQYDIYIANDGRNWSPPIASGTVGPGPTEVTFPAPTNTRWLRLVLTPPADDASNAALAEVELLSTEK